jgi:signal peptidase I
MGKEKPPAAQSPLSTSELKSENEGACEARRQPNSCPAKPNNLSSHHVCQELEMSEFNDQCSQTIPAPSTAGPAASAAMPSKMIEPKDSNRELLETVVFVVFLVLLLKAFVAEAYVIPTGSMATTLLGDHCKVTCEKCKYPYLLNAQYDNKILPMVTGLCPNCGQPIQIDSVDANGGDKVLVLKPRYDYAPPERHDVIVFKFPGGPQKDFIAHNYIKRLWGMPGDRLAIWYGDVYLRLGEGANERLEIIRRRTDTYQSMRRIVHHNDYLDPALPVRWRDDAQPPRWQAEVGGKLFRIEPAEGLSWLSYRNILRPDGPGRFDAAIAALPQLITDNVDYNSSKSYNWTPDLMLECEFDLAEPQGELVLELVGGVDLHRARFNLADGQVDLRTLRQGKPLAFIDEHGKELPAERAQTETKLKKKGKHAVRFCSFDQQLTLWVNDKLVFDEGLRFPAPLDEERGPRLADLQPVRIGAKQTKLAVSKLQIYRDIYYTQDAQRHDVAFDPGLYIPADAQQQLMAAEAARLALAEQRLPMDERALLINHRVRPEKWSPYYFRGAADAATRMTEPVFPLDGKPLGPDEYFALGDNSTASSDSRTWGPVPERLLLGKAVSVYFPLGRVQLIR